MAESAYLADTNILLRISKRQELTYVQVRTALRALRARGAVLCFTPQNLAEFWNVCTRPAEHNGLGLSVAETNRRAQLIESAFKLLADNEHVYPEWRRLIVAHSVMGVQVHDARLVAAMRVHGLTHILTLNDRDFARYTGISAVHPSTVVP